MATAKTGKVGEACGTLKTTFRRLQSLSGAFTCSCEFVALGGSRQRGSSRACSVLPGAAAPADLVPHCRSTAGIMDTCAAQGQSLRRYASQDESKCIQARSCISHSPTRPAATVLSPPRAEIHHGVRRLARVGAAGLCSRYWWRVVGAEPLHSACGDNAHSCCRGTCTRDEDQRTAQA